MAKFGARFIILQSRLKSNSLEMTRSPIQELTRMLRQNLKLMLVVLGEVLRLILESMEINQLHTIKEVEIREEIMMPVLVVEGIMKGIKWEKIYNFYF